MTTYNDLIDAGIILQGSKVVIKKFLDDGRIKSITEIDSEGRHIDDELDGEVQYIYADDNLLIIEIGE